MKTDTLKNLSFDPGNHEYMSGLSINAYDLDDYMNNEYRNSSFKKVFCSCDAYLNDNDNPKFIEFKNGTFHNDELYLKLIDSVLVMAQYDNKPLTYFKDKGIFILVFNPAVKFNKNKKNRKNKDLKQVFNRSAKYGIKRFGMDKYCNLLIHNVFTIEKDDFDDFFTNYLKIQAYL